MNCAARLLARLSLVTSAIVGVTTAQADPVNVSYTVTGSAGNWLLHFSVQNNLGGTNAFYFFGVSLPTRNISGSPTGWDPNAYSSWNNSLYGGSNNDYDNIWITSPIGPNVILTGQTLGGFQATSTSQTVPGGVNWFAYSGAGVYTGPGCAANCHPPFDNTGFEGVASAAATAVPELSTWTMMIIGFGVVGTGIRRNRRRTLVELLA